jgi:hypothetical protein
MPVAANSSRWVGVADAPLQVVVDRPQLQDGLEVPEGPLGLQQVLVAQSDVLGRL